MKRFLFSAAAIALAAGPLAAQAQPDKQRQDYHADRARPEHAAPARPAPQFHEYGGQNRGAPVQRSQPERFQQQGPQADRFQAQRFQQQRFQEQRFQDQRNFQAQRFQEQRNLQEQRNQDRVQAQRYQEQRFQSRQPAYNSERWAPNRPAAGYAARQAYQNGWSRGAQFQRNLGWWRERRGFEAYEGRRDGFWFAPGYGYYRPDPRWYGFNWYVGFTVPFELRSYYVSDPYDYGLPPAPYGCEWIFLGNQLVLINMETGQIVQIGYAF